jgi:hypothetical protein
MDVLVKTQNVLKNIVIASKMVENVIKNVNVLAVRMLRNNILDRLTKE